MTAVFRLIDDLDAPVGAASQMRRDVALIEEVESGSPGVLRLYCWDPPALSIGRFQDEREVDSRACAARHIEVVRRPTGGRALLHGGDLTYAVALAPVSVPESDRSVDAVYRYLAAGIVAGLAQLGVHASVARCSGPPEAVCLTSQQGVDLRVGTRKLCGSAQVRHRRAVLQHGSILLRRLPCDETDLLVGDHDRARLRGSTVTLEELGAPYDARTVGRAIVEGFRSALGLTVPPLA